mmetsp:Transcript_72710/g.189167  ORF Transcript_72710/g.189167 Transcript_72710/m.189167 type:complete len:564 (-) Transcript_72710:76-1767(-)
MGNAVRRRRQLSSGSQEQLPVPLAPRSAVRFLHPQRQDAITILTWNVAAVNNNPFEYWISYDDPTYLDLMQGVEDFLDNPDDNDAEVSTVFTDAMFQDLKWLCEQHGIPGIAEVENAAWNGGSLHLAKRRIVSEFIKDPTLGSKRLISMPDRVTNTINVVTRQQSLYRPPPACRPSVINNYVGDLSSREVWWERWKLFMFQESVAVRTRTGVDVKTPVGMLELILRSKYPAVTEDEERMNIPLQLLCLAIFDAVILHFMNKLSPDGVWQVAKARICDKLYVRKQAMTLDILARRYGEVQVVCLQEVAAVFEDEFRQSSLASTHELVCPATLNGKRDQNSFILLRHDAFNMTTVCEVTAAVASCTESLGGIKLSDGDLLAIDVLDVRGTRFLIASFHGDTNGLLTVPLVSAICQVARTKFPQHQLLVALDANVYERPGKDKKAFAEFTREIAALGLTSIWGDQPDVSRCRTTCSARTSLQPQLNKAVRLQDRVERSDMNPKDTILFFPEQLKLVHPEEMNSELRRNPVKDNTGRLEYLEASVFPTLDFPSDHGIVAVALHAVHG